jgi:hypothetical protein
MTHYTKPIIERLGTFRELTRWGFTGSNDGATFFGSASPGGCEVYDAQGNKYQVQCPTTS